MLWSKLFFKQLKYLRENVNKEAARDWEFWEHEGTGGENEHIRYKEYEKILIEAGLGPETQTWAGSAGYEVDKDGKKVVDENGRYIPYNYEKGE